MLPDQAILKAIKDEPGISNMDLMQKSLQSFPKKDKTAQEFYHRIIRLHDQGKIRFEGFIAERRYWLMTE